MLRYWTASSPTKTRETPHCLAKTLPFPLTPKAKSATTTTTTTLWVLWYIFSLNNKPLFYSYSDFVFVLFGKLLARNTYCLQTLFYTCDTSRRYNPTPYTIFFRQHKLITKLFFNNTTKKVFICSFEYSLLLVLQDSWCLGLLVLETKWLSGMLRWQRATGRVRDCV